jgi:hypothetical protein
MPDCERCKQHEIRVVAFRLPDEIASLEESELERRANLHPEVCRLDETRHFIRGVAVVPVTDEHEPFEWGWWAEVESDTFQRYLKLYRIDGTSEPPVAGRLANSPPGFPPALGHPLSIHFRGPAVRPHFTLARSEHPLSIEQHTGITGARFHEILQTCGVEPPEEDETLPRLIKCNERHDTTDWPFQDPPNVAAFTDRLVTEKGHPIVFVSHEEADAAWELMGPEDPRPEQRVVLCLQHLVERDPSLRELADLPLGWRAERASPRKPWKRTRNTD